MSTAANLFGSNSNGGLLEWLDVMCQGCKHESVAARKAGNGGGYGCTLAFRAVIDPYGEDIGEWSADASPVPGRFAVLREGPWPVCMAWQPRKTRADKGKRRGPRATGMEPLFSMEAG